MVTKSHSLSVGIVGLPNSGKSTLFNSLTKKEVPAENYPFCTIDKNVGVVEIPDDRLDNLSNHFKAEKSVPSIIKFVDIAGLVKGASKGEGLGNQFLAHIREVDAIMYVLRAFPSQQIVHVYNRVDPVADFEIVQSELILKDIESVERRLINTTKLARIGDSDAKEEKDTLEYVLEKLNTGMPAIDIKLRKEELNILRGLSLLSLKPRLFVLNCKEGISQEDLEQWENQLSDFVDGNNEYIIRIDVKLIGEIDDEGDYEELLGYIPNNIENIINTTYKKLDLITFYTGSSKECNSWSIQKGANIREAAGVIHTDLMDGFITAEVVNVDDMLQVGGWVDAKEKGIVKNYGKDYIVKDGDYILILANK